MTTTYLPELSIDVIRPHGANPRRTVGNVDDLAASITAHGLLEPLVVAPMNGSEYRLIAGHRRLAAAKQAGIRAVPALLRTDLDTPPAQLEAMLVENTQRTDLTIAEEAAAYAQLVAFPGYTPTKAAKQTGRSVKTVKSRIAIAALPEKTLEKVHAGSITLTDAEALAGFAGEPEYESLVKAAGTPNFGWGLRRAEESRAGRAALDVVRKWCADKGWPEVDERPDGHFVGVISAWEVVRVDVKKKLAELVDGPHVLVVDGTNGYWTLLHDVTGPEDTEEDDEPGFDAGARRAAWEAESAAREARLADVNTARDVRREWFAGRLKTLIVKDTERLPLLHLLVEEYIENGDWTAEDLTAAGFAGEMPDDMDDQTTAARAWAAGLNENQAWKALLVLSLDLGRCGSQWSENTHQTSIRAAIALGYQPSDIELQILGEA